MGHEQPDSTPQPPSSVKLHEGRLCTSCRLFSVSLKQMRCLPSQKQLSNREQEGWPIHPQKE